MRIARLVVSASLLFSAATASASQLEGPGRFCGYSPIIDLMPAERVTTLQGGIHGGTFRWEGEFGELEVRGIGWASRPRGRMAAEPTSKGHARFAQRRDKGQYVVAIWNRANGAAYFHSKQQFMAKQLAAIDRVDLFQEGQTPEGCDLRTVFSWE